MERNYNQGSKDSEIGSGGGYGSKMKYASSFSPKVQGRFGLSPKFKGDSEIISNSKETGSV